MTGFTNKPFVTARFDRLHPKSPLFQAGMRDRTRPTVQLELPVRCLTRRSNLAAKLAHPGSIMRTDMQTTRRRTETLERA